MTQQDAAAVVRAHIRAFNERDLQALLDGLADDATWTTGRTTVRGRADLTDLFRSAMTALEPTLTVRAVLADGDLAAAELTETLTVGGRRLTIPIAGFYETADERITRARIYREGSAEPG